MEAGSLKRLFQKKNRDVAGQYGSFLNLYCGASYFGCPLLNPALCCSSIGRYQ